MGLTSMMNSTQARNRLSTIKRRKTGSRKLTLKRQKTLEDLNDAIEKAYVVEKLDDTHDAYRFESKGKKGSLKEAHPNDKKETEYL